MPHNNFFYDIRARGSVYYNRMDESERKIVKSTDERRQDAYDALESKASEHDENRNHKVMALG